MAKNFDELKKIFLKLSNLEWDQKGKGMREQEFMSNIFEVVF